MRQFGAHCSMLSRKGYAGRGDPHPLAGAQFLLIERVQGLLLALAAEPYRFATVQIADHRDELLLLSQIDFIHAHLRQHWFAPRGRPTLQIAQVDRSHRAWRQVEPERYLSRRRTL